MSSGKFPRIHEYTSALGTQERFRHTDGELITALYKAKYNPANMKNIRLVNNVAEIAGYKKVGEKAMVRFIKNRKSPIISPSANINNVTRWILKIKSPLATVNIFKSGAIQIATAAPVEQVVRFLDQHYLPGLAQTPVEPVKIDGQFFLNFVIITPISMLIYFHVVKFLTHAFFEKVLFCFVCGMGDACLLLLLYTKIGFVDRFVFMRHSIC